MRIAPPYMLGDLREMLTMYLIIMVDALHLC